MSHLVKHRLIVLTALVSFAFAMMATKASAAEQAPLDRPIKLAVFEFELNDFGAAAHTTGEAPGDRYHLMLATDEARKLLAQSGQYLPLSADPAHGIVVRERALHLCNGCEARIASALGAEQSLLVVYTRISMTDYTMSYQFRDVRTGALLRSGTTDLRMGANYSWARGASWLVRNRLLVAAR